MRFGTASKFALSATLALLAFFLPWQASLVLFLCVVILEIFSDTYKPISAPAHKAFLRFLAYLVSLGLFMVFINGLLIEGDDDACIILGLSFYPDGLAFGLNVACRLMLLSSAILLFFVSTPIKIFADLLGYFGLPQKIISIILLTTFYLEQLPARIRQIFWSQEARGAPIKGNFILRIRSFFSILSPLVLSSLVESVNRGMALELRGFRGQVPPSRPRDVRDFRLAYLILSTSFVLLLWQVWK
ncbi:MAG: energy-coupling factor transporter transmembrane protein EcfT [Ignavibacteriales bacterium]|nr:energy-coupling factor transporter transmembrane protein EcfT [Ignavibacteriales bacterium]